MASIKNRGKNKWFVRVFLGREAGKVKFHDKLVRGEKKDAKKYADKIEAACDAGTLDQLLNPEKTELLTLGTYLDRWLAEAVKPTVRELTYDDYATKLRLYVRPGLGARALAEITPPDVQAVYNDMKARGLSTRAIQYTHSILSSALKQAVGWQIIPLNPAAYTKRPKSEVDELETGGEKLRVLDAKGAEGFIKAAKADPMGAALVFALATGARPEEYLALRWEDVDFARGRSPSAASSSGAGRPTGAASTSCRRRQRRAGGRSGSPTRCSKS